MKIIKVVKNEEYEKIALEVISSSRAFLHISTFRARMTPQPKGFGCNEIFHLVCEKAESGITVLFMFSDKALIAERDVGNENFSRLLSASGILTRHCVGRRISHAKMIISDSGIALVGSHNWTVGSLRRNFELSLLVSDIDVVKEIDEFYMREWNLGKSF